MPNYHENDPTFLSDLLNVKEKGHCSCQCELVWYGLLQSSLEHVPSKKEQVPDSVKTVQIHCFEWSFLSGHAMQSPELAGMGTFALVEIGNFSGR